VRAALALWLGVTAVRIVYAVAAGPVPGAVPGAVHRPRRRFAIHPWQVLVAAAVVLAAGLRHAPARLIVNLLGFLLLALPVLWLVRRRAGPAAAARAVVALAVFSFWPAPLNLSHPPLVQPVQPDAGLFWPVGWPGEEWVLRHQVQLEPPADGQAWELSIPFAAPYRGPSRIFATLDGVALGPARQNPIGATLDIPSSLMAGRMRLTLDLQARPVDPSFHLLAHPFVRGASLGADASEYFDGVAWQRGTFDVLAGQARPGVYLLRFSAKPAQ
jgi:hypothetical protein